MSQSGGPLELAHEQLYWPHPSQIWQPSGAGPSVYARLVEEKIGKTIRREQQDANGAKVGVLTANPEGDATEALIAIVCEFPKPVSEKTIKELHRLAWSFSKARSLITVEPHQLRIWTCCEPPERDKNPTPVITRQSPSEQAAQSLRWVDLVSGQFFQNHENRFQRSGAADQMLLENLKEVRQQLLADVLDTQSIHDLIARIIFIQFLWDRKDPKGDAALNSKVLKDLHKQGILSNCHKSIPGILENFDDTYQLFRWLNNKFNGDLFPGKGVTLEERESEWQQEIQKLIPNSSCLGKLANFVRGDLEMKSGQLCLWPMYRFDVIPLEFISSIYEEFVKEKSERKKSKKGVHYTPEYIVDFILDGVLPWDSKEWNFKILDPACGSGIFLVKAFQRLIYRWEKAHDEQRISANDLKYLLENNLVGVDSDKEAVRVASLSLYLTMLDSLDPIDYWENDVQLPRLRNSRLIAADFFKEDREGFRTNEDAGTYDLVVGNAPWGEKTTTLPAQTWATKNDWEISDNNIGLLFLPKMVALAKPGGTITMIQSAMNLLFNQSSKVIAFRNKLFSEFKIEEIVNLSALRFGLFENAISPSCIITLCNTRSDGEPLIYICPKPVYSNEDNYSIVIEPKDINEIYPKEARENSLVWTALMWGGRRDLALIKRLNQQESIQNYKDDGIAKARQGVIPGNRGRYQKELLGRRRLWQAKFPEGTFLFLDPEKLRINNNDPYIDSGTSINFSADRSAFEMPQLILKMSWQASNRRFQAVIIKSSNDDDERGIICSGSYVSVHAPQDSLSILEAACLSYNSKLAVYYLLLSSGRFVAYRPEIKPNELLRVPLPEPKTGLLNELKNYDDVDERIRQAFEFKDSEWVLIEDLFNYTLPDFKGNSNSPGRQITRRNEEPELTEYCKYFIRVIKAGFGQNKHVCATIFQESQRDYLPIRLVAIHLNQPIHEGIKIEKIDSPELLKRLNQLNETFMQQKDSDSGGIFYQRIARVYDTFDCDGLKVPTVYLIKPDKVRYWARSMGLHDADEVGADIMMSANLFDGRI
jgi:type I restriction-modification system DNA methylase subunit